jgi:hypothetical protein
MHREESIIQAVTAARRGGWRRYFRSLDKRKKRHNVSWFDRLAQRLTFSWQAPQGLLLS